MLYCLPMIIASSTNLAIYGGCFVPMLTRTMANSGDIYPELVDDTNHQNQAALMSMALIGVGEIFGGMIIGNVRDRTSNKMAVLV